MLSGVVLKLISKGNSLKLKTHKIWLKPHLFIISRGKKILIREFQSQT